MDYSKLFEMKDLTED